ncbi:MULTISPECIES: HEPN domain-containing protein [unclassified Inquilinus]|uniref:HEPN domain-containing protein n=1 Tax=unclassified Inquilinus TaxID=2645927 RepID=UPI003F8DA968
MQLALDARFKSLDGFISKSSGTGVPEEIQSQLFRFGTVLICGNIERCIEIILLHRIESKAHPRIISFVKSHFMRGTNFDCSAIGQLLNRFDPNWYRKFSDFVDQNADIKEGVSSCYAVRNSVAHGGAQSVGKKRLAELLDISRRLVQGVVDATK